MNWLWLALIGVALVVCLAYFDVEISARVLGVALISEVVIIAHHLDRFFVHAHDVAIVADPAVERLHLGRRAGGRDLLRLLVVGGLRSGAELRRGGQGPDQCDSGRTDLLVRRRRDALHDHVLGARLGLRHEHELGEVANTGNTPSSTARPCRSTTTTSCSGRPEPWPGSSGASALSYLIITGSLACAAALTNAGLRYMYAMGREGLLPRYLGKTHPVHKSPYTAVLTWGAVAVVLFLVFRVTNHTGLDAYFWFSPQGVIWIVLVQALTALSVFMYFQRVHPDEQSWKTTVCAWLGFAGQIAVLALFYHYETFVAAGDALYVKELFTIGSGTYSVPVSWLGIIGVGVPVVSMIYAYTIRASNPEKYALMGRFVNESV